MKTSERLIAEGRIDKYGMITDYPDWLSKEDRGTIRVSFNRFYLADRLLPKAEK